MRDSMNGRGTLYRSGDEWTDHARDLVDRDRATAGLGERDQRQRETARADRAPRGGRCRDVEREAVDDHAPRDVDPTRRELPIREPHAGGRATKRGTRCTERGTS